MSEYALGWKGKAETPPGSEPKYLNLAANQRQALEKFLGRKNEGLLKSINDNNEMRGRATPLNWHQRVLRIFALGPNTDIDNVIRKQQELQTRTSAAFLDIDSGRVDRAESVLLHFIHEAIGTLNNREIRNRQDSQPIIQIAETDASEAIAALGFIDPKKATELREEFEKIKFIFVKGH